MTALADMLGVNGLRARVDQTDGITVGAPHVAEMTQRTAEVVLAVLSVFVHVRQAVRVEHVGQPHPRHHQLHGVGAVEAVQAVDAEHATLRVLDNTLADGHVVLHRHY
ncbi:DNA topoisomerase IV subunit A, putative [Babesia ovata]|uniref:DNA topoisomerase IV subunit A, putative n=1 Tax=Babesia ovata TaxID=189622 RepID=A0A2H6KB01_9APIC|nr:DNA topoisomerase IV subunit A, putative [Babesia ovata]GBE60167.1 DNA topoisomerase IV subunit A, putative [Babesia ovata]